MQVEYNLQRIVETISQRALVFLEYLGDSKTGLSAFLGLLCALLRFLVGGQIHAGATVTFECSLAIKNWHTADADPDALPVWRLKAVFKFMERSMCFKIEYVLRHCGMIFRVDGRHHFLAAAPDDLFRILLQQLARIVREVGKMKICIHLPEPPVRAG